MESTRKDSIFTNVVLNLDVTRSGGEDERRPASLNWKGEKWDPSDGSRAHRTPVSRPPRRTAPISPKFEIRSSIDAIVFGGRRAKTVPLVYQSRDWEAGIRGSIMGSETTAATTGAVGVTRRSISVLQFCGYNMGDYFQHWLDMEKKISASKIFNVNWLGPTIKVISWPGFGRICAFSNGSLTVRTAPQVRVKRLSAMSRPEDINLEGIEDECPEVLRTSRRRRGTLEKTEQKEFYAMIGDSLPQALQRQLDAYREPGEMT